MANVPEFHPGLVPGVQNRDESGVAAVEFIALVESLDVEPSVLAQQIGMDAGQLSVLLSGNQKWISLKLADRILLALGRQELLQELVIIPGHLFSDAKQMAYYEHLDDQDEVTASLDEIMERAHELWAMREMMLSGDAEQVAFVKASFPS